MPWYPNYIKQNLGQLIPINALRLITNNHKQATRLSPNNAII